MWKSYFLPFAIILGFIAVNLLLFNNNKNYYKNQMQIDKNSTFDIEMLRTNWQRGVVSVNKSIFFYIGDFDLTESENNYLKNNLGMKRIRKESDSDTVNIIYQDTIVKIVFKY